MSSLKYCIILYLCQNSLCNLLSGPSGLLLAHKLIKSQIPINKLDIYEYRSDPRDEQNLGASRAYALGLGIRGRTAIQTVDNELWESVKKRGYECERFKLHLTPKINIKLRDREEGVQPSVLIYQSDLCGQLLDELEKRANANVVDILFDSPITEVDLDQSTMSFTKDERTYIQQPYDLIIGCDGANSIVRKSMQEFSPPNTFSYTQRKLLPGCFKTARAESMPPLIDPESVSLILPKSSSITAFVEPTVDGGGCILFAGKLSDSNTTSVSDSSDKDIGSLLFPRPESYKKGEPPQQSDIDTLSNLILAQFPLLEGTNGLDDLSKQLLSQRSSVASSVKCNTYSSSSGTPVAIVGDAGHATGGVSGQGCNSALMDAVTLSDCLEKEYKPPTEFIYNTQNAKRDLLHKGISSYSQKAVPEGHALYDLSFGNDGKTLPIFRNIKSLLSTGIDAVFRGRFGIGKKPLQTLLASSLTSFVDIRRDREKYYVEDFPSDETFRQELSRL